MADEMGEQGTVQIALRIAPDLRERIKAAADANNRSVNKELTATLEEKYPAPVNNSYDEYAERLAYWSNRAVEAYKESPEQAEVVLQQANDWLDTIPHGEAIRFVWAHVEGLDMPLPVVMGQPREAGR